MNNHELLALARQVRENAYAPYSGYRVGAALEAASGRVYLGCNVENASYGLTMCAERSALFAAIAAGETAFVRLAVAGSGKTPAYPCGACRQVLSEFAPGLEIICASKEQRAETYRLQELLPFSFKLETNDPEA